MARAIPPQDYEVTPLSDEDKHWRNGFDSRFMRYTWLNGAPRVVTIVAIENLKSSRMIKGQLETKSQRLITLAESEKKWATNITNCETIESLYGEDMHGWIGKRITLFPTKTRGPTGGMVDCMRVKPEVPKGQQAPPTPATSSPPAELSPRAEELAELIAAATAPSLLKAVLDQVAADKESGLLSESDLGELRALAKAKGRST